MAILFSREVARRAVPLILLCAGLAALPTAGAVAGATFIAAAIAVYLGLPRAHRPASALIYDSIPAVYGPDVLGFLLTGTFFALPFWARMGEAYLWDDFILVHPSALLTWPLALIALAILWFSAHYAAFWLVIEKDGLLINRLEGARFVAFSSIGEIRPFRRGLPKWVRRLVPFLVAAGKYGPAGAVLLARDSVGITLALDDGTKISIPQEGFEKPLRRLLAVLHGKGVRFAQK